MKRIILSCLLVTAFLSSSRGNEPTSEDKSHFTLFNPTPADSLRVWRTDHAGVVPYTVDAGHFEVDVTPVSYGYDEEQITVLSPIGIIRLHDKTEVWRYGFTEIKIGLLNRLDAEVFIEPYQTITRTLDAGALGSFRRTDSGFGDVTSRLKLNVWGNDGGKTALSISGNATFPTGDSLVSGGRYEGGPSLEFAAQLPWGLELRIDSAATIFKDNHNDVQTTFENLISLSHAIVGKLEGYCVFNTLAFTSGGDWVGEIKTGLNYRLAKNIELYVGSSFGLTDNALDYQPFAGVAARF